jgi:hypothetical protein
MLALAIVTALLGISTVHSADWTITKHEFE